MANRVEIVIDAKDNATKVLEGVSGSLKGVAQTAAGVFTGGLALEALGRGVDLLRDSAALAFRVSTEISDGTRQINAALGNQVNVATDYEAVLKGIYSNNFGENFADIADVVVEVEQNTQRLGGVTQRVLQQMSEDALGVRDVFKIDTGDSIQAAATLMDQFGLTSDQAMDFVVGGLQRGLNASNDFFDSINEYSTQFKQGGADAGEFFSILETGFQGGVLGTDKVADMFKEFRLRIGDGSKATNEALDTLFNGVTKYAGGVEGFLSDLSNGTLEQVDAFDLVIDALAEIDDENQRLALGTALLGTQFEDLGDSVALGVNKSKTGMDELAGSTDLLNVKYDNLGNTIQTLWRKFKVGLDPLGDVINEFLVGQLPLIESVMNRVIARMGEVFDVLTQGFDAGGLIGGVAAALAELTGGDYTIDVDAKVLKAEPIPGVTIEMENGKVNRIDASTAIIDGTIIWDKETNKIIFQDWDVGVAEGEVIYDEFGNKIVFNKVGFGAIEEEIVYDAKTGEVIFHRIRLADDFWSSLESAFNNSPLNILGLFGLDSPGSSGLEGSGLNLLVPNEPVEIPVTIGEIDSAALDNLSSDATERLNNLKASIGEVDTNAIDSIASDSFPALQNLTATIKRFLTPTAAGGLSVDAGGFGLPTLSGGGGPIVGLVGKVVDWAIGNTPDPVDIEANVSEVNTNALDTLDSADFQALQNLTAFVRDVDIPDTVPTPEITVDANVQTADAVDAAVSGTADVPGVVTDVDTSAAVVKPVNVDANISEPDWGEYTFDYDVTATVNEDPNWGSYTHDYNATATIFRQPNWGNYTHIYNATARITGVNWGNYTHAYRAVANITERVTRVVTETTTPRFASGTSFTQAGLAYVHQGEVLVNAPRGGQVITKDAALSALKGGGGGGDIHLHIGNISVGAGGNAFQAGQQLGRGFLSEARALGKI